MKKLILLSIVFLAGCGPSQRELKYMNTLLEDSKSASCGAVRTYLDEIQKEIQKKIR